MTYKKIILYGKKNKKCLVSSLFLFLSQYIILEIEKDLMLPLANQSDDALEFISIKKAKGVKRGIIQDTLTKEDYHAVGVLGHTSRSVTSYGFKKFAFNIFLNLSKRRLLTRGNSKRIFFPSSQGNESFFSFPLFVKELAGLLEKD